MSNSSSVILVRHLLSELMPGSVFGSVYDLDELHRRN